MAKNMLANLNAIVANTLNESIQMIDIDELSQSQILCKRKIVQ